MQHGPAPHDVRITGLAGHLPAQRHDSATLPPLDEPIAPADLYRIGGYRRALARARVAA